VQQARSRASQVQGNQLSVRQELQADCLAGVWAHHNQQRTQFLEQGDVQEAMDAAHKIGDDYLQKSATGQVVPDSFTHGTSAQRMQWFQTGLKSGDLNRCDTFNQPV
jgi:predicted metalloprotease